MKDLFSADVFVNARVLYRKKLTWNWNFHRKLWNEKKKKKLDKSESVVKRELLYDAWREYVYMSLRRSELYER